MMGTRSVNLIIRSILVPIVLFVKAPPFDFRAQSIVLFTYCFVCRFITKLVTSASRPNVGGS